MRQLTVNIPDYYYKAFMDYFKRIPEASILNDSSVVLDETLLKMLDGRQKTPDHLYLTREESNLKLKRKNGL